jgi:Flp pilus assembly protein CpaB
MKVVKVPVSDNIIPDKSLLCPGCFVDVKASLGSNTNRGRVPKVIPKFIVDLLIKCKLIRNRGGTVSATMLRGIPVLSVKRSLRGTFVNLLVTTRQAEALQLAINNSNISLAIRNPSERKPAKKTIINSK